MKKYKIIEIELPTGVSTSILNKNTGVICPQWVGNIEYDQFVNDIYIAGSSKDDGTDIEDLQVKKPRKILLQQWPELDLIIFIG